MPGKFSVGDIVEVVKNGKKFTGTVMPRSDLSDPNYIVLKDPSGYNYGINLENAKIKKTGVSKRPSHKPVKLKVRKDPKKPNISILSTGGTISSKIDYHTGGISASYSAEDLVSAVPELSNFANIKSKLLMSIMSENIVSENWIEMAKAVAKEIKTSEGIILTHGTDTLVYTSAMLSYMLQNLPVPVILTFAQKSSDRGSSDAFLNMLCSTITATSDIAEVVTVGHGSSSDDFCLVNRGTKVRKMHSSRRDTFRPINEPPLAKVWPTGDINIINNNFQNRGKRALKLDTKINPKVAIVKFYANMDPKVIDMHVKAGYDGIIIQGTGLGYVNSASLKSIKQAVDSGVFIGMTTQEYGRVNPHVYSVLREISDAGVVYLEDMTTESAYAKLIWVLGHTKNLKQAKEMMLTNMVGEISVCHQPETFLY